LYFLGPVPASPAPGTEGHKQARPTAQNGKPLSRRVAERARRRCCCAEQRPRALRRRMVFLESLDAFVAEAEKLYVEHPDHTRYVTKYRHCDGKLELKVTNDRVCLKYVTDQQQDLKRIEKLNNLFLTYMCGKDPYAADAADEQTPVKGERPASGGDDAAAAEKPSERPSSGGGKKKKAKK
jgi:signal recognition particle subunit SRP9